jgi:hypothetical protein
VDELRQSAKHSCGIRGLITPLLSKLSKCPEV